MKLYQIISLLLLTVFTACSQPEAVVKNTDGTAKSTDGTPIYYRTYGSGEPLLIINGGPGMNSNGFEQLAMKLSKNYKTILYDQRGTGKSVVASPDTTNMTMKLMMDDIEALRKQLNIKQWSVLGHSFGGILVSYYATQYPSSIHKIILSSSGGIDLELLNDVGTTIQSKLSAQELEAMNYWTNKINNGDTTYHARLERGKAMAPAYVVNKKFVPQLAVRMTQGNSTINGLMWDNLRKINYDCAEALKNYDKPVLILQGKQDILKSELSEKAHRVLKNSKLVMMDHCGHYGWLDNEEVYFTEINAFLAPSYSLTEK